MHETIKSKIFNIVLNIFVITFCGAWLLVYPYNLAREASFNIDVLERYIHAYQLVEQESIKSLKELPKFDIISPKDSLSLKSEDLRTGQYHGYRYDLQFTSEDQFVISASPIKTGLFSPNIEFGIIDDGILRFNDHGVDSEPDTYTEVKGWKGMERIERIRTKKIQILP